MHQWILLALSNAGLAVRTADSEKLPERLAKLHGRAFVCRAGSASTASAVPEKLPIINYRLNEAEWRQVVAFAEEWGLTQRMLCTYTCITCTYAYEIGYHTNIRYVYPTLFAFVMLTMRTPWKRSQISLSRVI